MTKVRPLAPKFLEIVLGNKLFSFNPVLLYLFQKATENLFFIVLLMFSIFQLGRFKKHFPFFNFQDLLSVPDFLAGAMEDWGLVSFRSSYLLYDEKRVTLDQKKMITLVIAHELAHQVKSQ